MEKVKIYNLRSLGKVHSDERGWMSQVEDLALSQGFAIKNIHIGSIAPGQSRANHFHKRQREWIMIFGSAAIFAWKDEDIVVREDVRADEVMVFEVAPGCVHAVKNISTRDIYICAFTDQAYDKEDPDTVREVII